GIRMTADDLLRMPRDGKRRELVKGELHEMSPAGGEHGFISNRAQLRLGIYLDQHPEIGGGLFAAETGFRISRDPDTVRAPDVAYVVEARLAQARVAGYPDLAPDLIVEVVSPNDTASEVQAKIDEWLRAGVRLAWVLYPATHSAMVFHVDGTTHLLHADDNLTGDPVLPGFSCRLRELF
ncbi:MAG: Uma2 family endonuclease, partial [Chloroflexota bacterium]